VQKVARTNSDSEQNFRSKCFGLHFLSCNREYADGRLRESTTSTIKRAPGKRRARHVRRRLPHRSPFWCSSSTFLSVNVGVLLNHLLTLLFWT
jgi:hypothetical protein